MLSTAFPYLLICVSVCLTGVIKGVLGPNKHADRRSLAPK